MRPLQTSTTVPYPRKYLFASRMAFNWAGVGVPLSTRLFPSPWKTGNSGGAFKAPARKSTAPPAEPETAGGGDGGTPPPPDSGSDPVSVTATEGVGSLFNGGSTAVERLIPKSFTAFCNASIFRFRLKNSAAIWGQSSNTSFIAWRRIYPTSSCFGKMLGSNTHPARWELRNLF